MEKILIVDDDPAVLKVLTMRLEAEKYSVMGVASGNEALALQNQGFFDLALIDHQYDSNSIYPFQAFCTSFRQSVVKLAKFLK